MGQESIKVVFEPLAGPFSHGTLVYTNSAGQVFVAAGDRSNTSMSDTQVKNPVNIILGDMAATGIGSSPYGSLITFQGLSTDPSISSKIGTWLAPGNSETILSTGVDLSSQWATISSAMTQINAAGFAYGPTNQNSNSAWCTAVNAASIPVPAVALFSEIGCGNVLPTSFRAAADSVTTVASVDSNGAQIVTVTDPSAGGGQVTKEVDGANSSGTISYDEFLQTTASGTVSVSVSGGGAVLNLSNAAISLTAPGTWATVNGNNSITLAGANTTLTVNDGAVDSIYGLAGNIHGSYGTLNLATNTGINFTGNSEQVNGGVFVGIAGKEVTVTGSGEHVSIGSESTVTVNGANAIDISSDVVLTASNSTLSLLYGGMTGVDIMGSHDVFSNAGLGMQATIEGTYDTGLMPNDSLVYLGATTGDTIGSGTVNTTPDYTNGGDYSPESEDDPIILNLSGGKVQTQNLVGSSAYFDMQNNGTSDHTGWGTAGEGYLIYDINNKNTVTNEQSLLPNFAALHALDSNGDGILNSLDAAWSHLKVWVDSAGNGSFVAGSLKAMAQIGISSINLNSTHLHVNQNNNNILDDSTFTWNSGATGDIAGVELNFHASTVLPYVAPPPAPSCVQIGSVLPCGTIAGDVKVGATLQLADEATLAAHTGEVTFSKRVTVMGVRITTQSGVTLVCSESAPIPTPEGLVLAPHLRGKKVPTRLDGPSGSHTAWEMVEVVESVGEIEVQHISVNDKCFWAGEKTGAYILHHNKVIHSLP